MSDLFASKADDWDERPIPAQISEGVFAALQDAVALSDDMVVMDFGAGTGLICTKIAPLVKHIIAVDISQSMLNKLAQKPALQGKSEIVCQDILEQPLDRKVDLIVSAMATHHVEDTLRLLRAWPDHLVEGGQVAIADLDKEDGDFHPPDTEGVFHHGFDREVLGEMFVEAGFTRPSFVTACEVSREQKTYPVFLLTATRVES